MTKLQTLKDEAREACGFREHKMGIFKFIPTTRDGVATREQAEARCKLCGMAVYVNTRPLPNGIDIMGEAVALTCTGEGSKECTVCRTTYSPDVVLRTMEPVNEGTCSARCSNRSMIGK